MIHRQPAPAQYPSNARCFVHLDARLLPYWHSLFDICPALLKLDPPEGLNLFRSFMTWAYRNQPAADWTYHLNVCRWLLGSAYRTRINEEPIEAFMAAAAASWINTDHSQAEGIVLAWRALRVFDWKVTPPAAVEQPPLPASAWDFAWSPLSQRGECYGWQVLT
ncbi:putative natural product biosynthesis protein [Pseudomonas rhodesiae]|uniref:putative natural product biosynthesis protein n=1 Tax=Pseudomonas rhodesiae TaxID=76760 RepID=UPI000F487941|nr:putative natural product biosynthesis protein [Pseudomonas rhodesiae]ROM53693.1 putative natural product biosynthesis protein [Pseudomonas rhodesiae]ROM65220.1 putative natural product biosynthesis protein [Pseudomonas rhodesiae]